MPNDPKTTALYDVVAVDISTGARRVLYLRLSNDDAEAMIRYAVMRRGAEREFFCKMPAGETP